LKKEDEKKNGNEYEMRKRRIKEIYKQTNGKK
jgi:hypothetical protein